MTDAKLKRATGIADRLFKVRPDDALWFCHAWLGARDDDQRRLLEDRAERLVES